MIRRLAVAALCFACLLIGAAPAHAITRGVFADELTRQLGAEVTLHTRRAWMAEFQAEGGQAAFNPANTTMPWAGSTCYNAICVRNYRTAEDGIAATVKTLEEPNHGYGWIIQALRRNYSATRTLKAIGRSDWGTLGGLALAVLDDIKNNRWPNTLHHLELTNVAS
jgi:hypothetical protein